MKKYLLLLAMVLCILSMPVSCYAKELFNEEVVSSNICLLANGYTDDGVYYEVYGEPFSINSEARAYVDVERTVVYVGEVFPPSSIEWTERVGNMYLSGTLYLDSFVYNASTNRTTAYYQGTLSNN